VIDSPPNARPKSIKTSSTNKQTLKVNKQTNKQTPQVIMQASRAFSRVANFARASGHGAGGHADAHGTFFPFHYLAFPQEKKKKIPIIMEFG